MMDEDYIPFGIMLANGGELNGKRLLSRKTVETLRLAHVPDTLPGRAAGEGYGLGVRVVTDRVKRESSAQPRHSSVQNNS